MVWFVRSVCPSVSGRYAVDILGFIPKIFRNSFQQSEVNRVSRSEIMLFGTPWIRQISLTNILARSGAFFVSFRSGIKCAIFVNLSMITHISVCPSEAGKSVMKSIEIESQGLYGVSVGSSSP